MEAFFNLREQAANRRISLFAANRQDLCVKWNIWLVINKHVMQGFVKKLGMIDEILTGIMRIMKQSFNDFFSFR